MYSPKVDEKLIPRLYLLGKARNKPMTAIVNEMLKTALRKANIISEINAVKVRNELSEKLSEKGENING